MVFLTMEQAEELFKSYGGSLFHMYREDYYLSQLYDRLNVPKETEERWRRELEAEKAKRKQESDNL